MDVRTEFIRVIEVVAHCVFQICVMTGTTGPVAKGPRQSGVVIKSQKGDEKHMTDVTCFLN